MEDRIITERLNNWTKGLDPKAARISVFKHIRDIPYAIIPKLRDPYKGPAAMIRQNRGSCQPKHWLLAAMFTRLGIPVEYATYPFKWYDPEIKWPADILEVIKNLPGGYHLACKANIDNKWVLIDATWDLPLAKAGFRVNRDWDGSGDTINAIRPTEEVIHKKVEERVSYEMEQKRFYTEEDKAVSAVFIKRLNAWLEDIRGGGRP